MREVGVQPDVFRLTWQGSLRSRFQFGVEIGDDILEGRYGLLDRRDLHQFPAAYRPDSVLQRDNQIPPLLLELNKRQTVVRQMSHHDASRPRLTDKAVYPDDSAVRLQKSRKF